MIINYKNELLNEAAVIHMIDRAVATSVNDIDDSKYYCFDMPLSNALSCIAATHKMEYINLASPNGKRRPLQEVLEKSQDLFNKQEVAAIRAYQTAKRRKEPDELKPYQLINRYLYKNVSLNTKQTLEAARFVSLLDSALKKASRHYSLKVGQRLYRGLSMKSSELLKYLDAEDSGATIAHSGYMSTSLSESIARTFAAWGFMKSIVDTDNTDEESIQVVMMLTNTIRGLPFLQPDVLRTSAFNQGQLEVLLPRSLHLRPTHLEVTGKFATIYADIVEER